mmetsp:Transcript_10665/g.27340  ORF Transcript_10665/g.27340 Transcript_10665/m.27340 type:complete len:516 (-) Transcript_10665:127-1674(-)
MVAPTPTGEKGVNLVWLAQSRLRRRKYDECIDICTELLDKNPYDQGAWYLKARALSLKNWLDDTEMEEEGIAEVLLDDNAVASVARPGTSLARPLSSAGGPSQAVRPMSSSGRPLTGFQRPGTSSRSASQGRLNTGRVETAFQGGRPGTSRPVTSSGRFVRLGTASMLSEASGPFINVDRLDLAKYAKRPMLARVLCDYILYHDHNPKKALELCAYATAKNDFQDWWWKARLGKCYYQLGLFREAERQFQSSIRDQNNVTTVLELCKVYIRLDQPNTALEAYLKASEEHRGDVSLVLGAARIHDALNDMEQGVQLYKKVLFYEASNVEAIACLASYHFYTDQPEIALRFYRRLLQIGVNNTELWNNLGLCCFYASQYDMALHCFERALSLADDANMADVWYNIGQIAIGIGDLGLAYQSFKVAVSVDANHAEAFNNLGVLEQRKGNGDMAQSNFQAAINLQDNMYEAQFNAGLLALKSGAFEESHAFTAKALESYPEHADSQELMKQLRSYFAML